MGPASAFGEGMTEAVMPGSGKTVRVATRQVDEGVKTLGRDEFRKVSMEQKQKDKAATRAQDNPPTPWTGREGHTPPQPPWHDDTGNSSQRVESSETPKPKTNKRRPGRPKGSRNKPKGGKTSQEPSTTSAQPPAESSETNGRLDRLERGLDMLVSLMSQQPHGNPLASAPQPSISENTGITPNATGPEVEVTLDEDELPGPEVDDSPEFEPGDPELAELSRTIQKRNPMKFFRQLWRAQGGPSSSFMEWPQDMQEEFERYYQEIVYHPGFLHGIRRTMRQTRNGAIMGPDYLARLCMMIAGCAAFYRMSIQDS